MICTRTSDERIDPNLLPPLRELPSPVRDKWQQEVTIKEDGTVWLAPVRPETDQRMLLNWTLMEDIREGDKPQGPGGNRRSRHGNGWGRVLERPDDGRRRILSTRAVAIVRLYLAEAAPTRSGSSIYHSFQSLRQFPLWLARRAQYLPADRPFEWSDLTFPIVSAFLHDELKTPAQGDTTSELRKLLEWGSDPETALPDFDETLYFRLKLMRLPGRVYHGAADLADPRRGAFDAEELDQIRDAVETFDTAALGFSEMRRLELERGRATAWTLLHTGNRPVQLGLLRNRDLIATPLLRRDPTAPLHTLYHLRVKKVKQRHTEDDYILLRISPGCGALLEFLMDRDAGMDAPLLWWLAGDFSTKAGRLLKKFFRAADLRSRRLPLDTPPLQPEPDLLAQAHTALATLTQKQRDAFVQWEVHRLAPAQQARLYGGTVDMYLGRVDLARTYLAIRAPAIDVGGILRAAVVAENPMRCFHRMPVFVYRFRYGIATDQKRKGASLRSIAEFLGHADTQVVERYTENTPEIADEFKKATDWAVVPVVRRMRGQVDDPPNPSPHSHIPGRVPHLSAGRALPVIGPIGKCGRDGSCPKNPVVSCFTCDDFVARPDGATTIRELRASVVTFLDELGRTTSPGFTVQLRVAIRAMDEWIDHLEELEAASTSAVSEPEHRS